MKLQTRDRLIDYGLIACAIIGILLFIVTAVGAA